MDPYNPGNGTRRVEPLWTLEEVRESVCVYPGFPQDGSLAVGRPVSILVLPQVYTGFQNRTQGELRRGRMWTSHVCICTLVSSDPYLQNQEGVNTRRLSSTPV